MTSSNGNIAEDFLGYINSASEILGGEYVELAEHVHQESCPQTDKMVAAICLHAFIFQHIIAEHHLGRVIAPSEMFDKNRTDAASVLEEWDKILGINNYPIFGIAKKCVKTLSVNDKDASEFCRRLICASNHIARPDPFAAHHIAGELFGSLISDRKMLASFYTQPTAASLLSELAISRLGTDWTDISQVKSLRIADFACGTGSLLNAAYQRIRAYLTLSEKDPEEAHRHMLEEVFLGADIMPAAVHIAAASLSAVYPQIDYTSTNLHIMPYGDFRGHSKYGETSTAENVRVGSLELLLSDKTPRLFSDEASQVDPSEYLSIDAPDESFDVILMNPPYTKPTNHKTEERQKVALPNFAAFGTSEEVQSSMNQRANNIFKDVKKRLGVSVRNGQAGMGTDFFDLAHAKIKPGGIIGFVLSGSMLTGQGWESVRCLLDAEYENVLVISISNSRSGKSSFSANTSIAEVLIIAEKKAVNIAEPVFKKGYEWTWATLNNLPTSTSEAVEIARQISSTKPGKNETLGIFLGEVEYGNVTLCDRAYSPAMLREKELISSLLRLVDPKGSNIYVKQTAETLHMPLCSLSKLGTRGPVSRDICSGSRDETRGGFTLSEYMPNSRSRFPILWAHDHTKETSLIIPIDKKGDIAKHKDETALKLWKTATRLHFTHEFGLLSQPFAACLTEEKTIGGRAWPSFTLQPEGSPREHEEMPWVYPVVLWANSTLGLMSFYILGTRNQAGRTVVSITALPKLLVLDPRQLSDKQLSIAKNIFDRFESKSFLPANLSDMDPVRHELDEAMLCELLGYDESVLSELETIRSQWCNEPHLFSNRRMTYNREEETV